MGELREECGVAAVYHLPGRENSPLCPEGPEQATRLLPKMLLDIQNRGQLAAGMTRYRCDVPQLLLTHKEVGSVSEVFALGHRERYDRLMSSLAGPAGIGHVRYATCGRDDVGYAQPFERHHIKKHKVVQLRLQRPVANYQELRDRLLEDNDHHLIRETDTEVIAHLLEYHFEEDAGQDILEAVRHTFE